MLYVYITLKKFINIKLFAKDIFFVYKVTVYKERYSS